MSEEFQYIDPKPLASASVAQVHRAKLRTGEEVVLKVRPSNRKSHMSNNQQPTTAATTSSSRQQCSSCVRIRVDGKHVLFAIAQAAGPFRPLLISALSRCSTFLSAVLSAGP